MEHRPVVIFPVRVGYRNVQLACDATRVVGYRARCACGVTGPVKATVALARHALSDHVPYPGIGTGSPSGPGM